MFVRPRIIPVLLIDDRDLIKTINFKERTYLGDPVNAVKIFNRKGIDELAILDIGATSRHREPDFEILKDIAAEAFMPLAYGGGITTVEQARELAKIGYEKVVINTQLIRNPELVKRIVEVLGSQSVVASIDAKLVHGKYMCAIHDGQEIVKISPKTLAKQAEELGAGEIFINSVDRDGMMSGYDLKLVKNIVNSVNIPVTACGGAAGIEDLKEVLHKGHAHAAAGGSMFVYYGKLKAVLITAPTEEDYYSYNIFKE
ncbi:imidazoleglycerol phosphate synthase, cyclase subunit [Eubacterium sp. 14-2]|uniref:AglZ/HisF2 family acetamidino modification protein n=1 Tax=Eubacterium sp. 14-2 TaxID=1235790 RepID=UPI0003410227|nr:AglZ/HisF2 family acetamidino modification protein [Eubacterium sp. 14-2]EOT28352.1 imidazoleglycerol phosphate synthase, cyclase subunit [Eubacterium sp. 14-2]